MPGHPPVPIARPMGTVTMRDFMREQQRAFVARAISEHGGNLAAAARALGMDRGNLHHLARRLGLVRGGG